MSFEWKQVRLGDFIDSSLGKMLDQKKNRGTFHPYLGNSNVRWGEFDLHNLAEMKFEDTEHERYTLKKGDLVVCEGGEPGRCAIWEDEIPGMKIQKALHRIRTQPGLIAGYLYYWFLFVGKIGALEPYFTGTTIKHLTGRNLANLTIKLPPIKHQEKCALVLSSIDRKINHNKKINQTLEQMAQALFKSWFIDFEPVKAKIAVLEAGGSQEVATLAAMTAISGKNANSLTVFEREHPEKYAEIRATAELFPSAMQDIESAKIPEGWNLVPLRNIASFASGKINVSELTKDTYISTENMLVNKIGVERATSLPSANTTPSFEIDHILISNIRPYFKKIWLARFSGGRSPDVLAFEHKKNITAEYLYNVLYQDSFFDFMMQTSKGVKMPRGDKKAIMEWSCIEPDTRLVKVFSNKVKEFYSYIESHNRENTQLSQLRDTLLPKLLSGEITLPEAEELAKEADYV